MKRTLSITLIALVLFNTIGYHAFFLVLQYQNARKIVRTLDADHENLSDIVSIKIPITIPYATDTREYVRVDGVIEYQGEFLRLVKQRHFRDTVEIVEEDPSFTNLFF